MPRLPFPALLVSVCYGPLQLASISVGKFPIMGVVRSAVDVTAIRKARSVWNSVPIRVFDDLNMDRCSLRMEPEKMILLQPGCTGRSFHLSSIT